MKTSTLREIRLDTWDDEPTNPGYRRALPANDPNKQEDFRQARTCPEIPSLRIGAKSIIIG